MKIERTTITSNHKGLHDPHSPEALREQRRDGVYANLVRFTVKYLLAINESDRAEEEKSIYTLCRNARDIVDGDMIDSVVQDANAIADDIRAADEMSKEIIRRVEETRNHA